MSSFDCWCNFWAWMISFYLLTCYYLHYPLWGKTLRLICDNRKDPCVIPWFWSHHSLRFLLAAQRITSSPGRSSYLQSCHHEFTTEKKSLLFYFCCPFPFNRGKNNLVQHKLHLALTKNNKSFHACLPGQNILDYAALIVVKTHYFGYTHQNPPLSPK